jgi:DNA invertase Pin-like site-specific DNA recombinase
MPVWPDGAVTQPFVYVTDMQLGYLRISKADGSQVLDLQRDALLAAGVEAGQLYHDLASGKRDDRPGLAACLKALRPGDVLVAWKLLYSGKLQ